MKKNRLWFLISFSERAKKSEASGGVLKQRLSVGVLNFFGDQRTHSSASIVQYNPRPSFPSLLATRAARLPFSLPELTVCLSLTMPNPALLAVTCYFILNLIVTITNKKLVAQSSCPHLLTASHAFSTFITTNLITSFQIQTSLGQQHTSSNFVNLSLRAHTILICFSLLYTINIAVSNLSLGLISLSLHQTIRATAPAITVLLCVTLLRRPLSSYSTSTYLSLIPTIAGVILATTSPNTDNHVPHGPRTSPEGILLTFLGAVLAVLKTILTNTLQQRAGRLSLNIPSITLIRYLSPYAVAQALVFALWTGEFQRLRNTIFLSNTGEGRISVIAAANVLAAALLNLTSFEANRRCGPLAMAIVANLKQVAVLMFDQHTEGDGWRVVGGALMTVIGGVWYAFSQKQNANRNGELERVMDRTVTADVERLGGGTQRETGVMSSR